MSFDRRASVMLRTGRPGSGKTWSLVRYLVDEYLPDHAGQVYTNLPLKVESIADYCAANGLDRDKVLSRLVLIPAAIENQWLAGEGTPEEWFQQLQAENLRAAGYGDDEAAKAEEDGVECNPLKYALVVIDEAGKMWPNRVDGAGPGRKECTAKFTRWVRTIRHDGARLILIAQDAKQLDASLRRLVQVELHTLNLADERERATGALQGDWLQVWAKLAGKYTTWCRERECVADGEDMRDDHSYARPMLTKYFSLYDSHNREGGGSGSEEKMEWERFGWLRFAAWLVKRNWFNWGWRGIACLVFWVLVLPPFSLVFSAAHWLRTEAVAMVTGKKPVAKSAAVGGGAVGMPGDAASLDSQLRAERAKVAELEQRLGADSSVVFITHGRVITDDGEQLGVGDRFEFGRFKGRQVVAVDRARRRVTLDDGYMLRLRRVSDGQAGGEIGTPSPVVAGRLPESSAGVQEDRDNGTGEETDVLRGGDAGGGPGGGN